MSDQSGVRNYIHSLFVKQDAVLEQVLHSIKEAGMPTISVPAETGKLLHLLVKLSGAKRVLEIGSLGGYSSIWLARALPVDGTLLSLELKEAHAEVAKRNVKNAGLEGKVRFRIGPAQESLNALVQEGQRFDFFFIDADKKNYPHYLEMTIKLAEPGALITADNVLWKGKVTDPNDQDDITQYLHRFNVAAANHPRLESMVLPIGDGLFLGQVQQ